jgi:hypothetical protein
MSKIIELINHRITVTREDMPQHLNVTLRELSKGTIIVRINRGTNSISNLDLSISRRSTLIIGNVSCNIATNRRR